jgi:hypothetical protein
VRALLLQGLGAGGIRLHRLDSSNIEDSDRVAARWRVETAIE